MNMLQLLCVTVSVCQLHETLIAVSELNFIVADLAMFLCTGPWCEVLAATSEFVVGSASADGAASSGHVVAPGARLLAASAGTCLAATSRAACHTAAAGLATATASTAGGTAGCTAPTRTQATPGAAET